MSIKEILEYNFLSIGHLQLSIYHILIVMVIILFARTLVWVLERIARRHFNRKNVEKGRQYAFIQIIKYFMYTITVLMCFEAIGISLSLLWGGAAALLVGIGLGLQQTFNDIISGLIILLEGTVQIDDVIEVNGMVGSVTEIGIRTSKMLTRDKISIIIPNSKLVVENAVNWSHSATPTRFKIVVGVSYKSDVEKVTNLLIQAAKDNKSVLETPKPNVQFQDFGNSSLEFSLYFFSYEFLGIEVIKSDIRYRIFQLFRENNVEIPFPQQDLWLKNPELLKSFESMNKNPS